MRSALRFKQTDIGRQEGELARFKVIQGPDYGVVYIITAPSVTIGRGEENDIVLSDLKASRIHAEVKFVAPNWRLIDHKSMNGILLNAKKVLDENLKIGDVVTLGETLLEFTTADVGTQMLIAPPRSPEQVQAEQKRINEIHNIGKVKSQKSKTNPNPLLLIAGVGIVALFLMFGGDEKSNQSTANKGAPSTENLAAYLPQFGNQNSEQGKTVEALFKDGFREYLAGNFNRARTQFETVLQIVPGHPMATLYLENCSKSVEGAVKHHLEIGRKAEKAGKLREARANFERILRLLYRDQTNPAFIEAKEQLDQVNKVISGEDAG